MLTYITTIIIYLRSMRLSLFFCSGCRGYFCYNFGSLHFDGSTLGKLAKNFLSITLSVSEGNQDNIMKFINFMLAFFFSFLPLITSYVII
jgi:hypothetical protein